MLDSKPTWEIVVITPEEAKRICDEQGLRDITLGKREQRDMERNGATMISGRWRINGDALVYDANGKLTSGRKRILTAILYNTSFPTLIIRGVNPEDARVVKQHRRRTAADSLATMGKDNSRALAPAARLAVSIATANSADVLHSLGQSEIPLVVSDHPALESAVASVVGSPSAKYLAPGLGGALKYLTSLIDSAASRAFFATLDKVLSDPATGDSSPASVLAEALRPMIDDPKRRGSATAKLAVFTKAWNAERSGRPVSRLTWDAGEVISPLDGLPGGLFEKYLGGSFEKGAKQGLSVLRSYHQQVASDDIRVRIVTVTPDMARDWLERNGPSTEGMSGNRRRSETVVLAYARDMARGRWVLNGQAIRITKAGRLVDGQHRLAACVMTGLPFTTYICEGLDENVFPSFDMGTRKSFSQILKERGVGNPNDIQGATRIVWNYETTGLGSAMVPTLTEFLDVFERHPDMPSHIKVAHGHIMHKMMGKYLATGMSYILGSIDHEKAEAFFNSLERGVMLDEGMPVHTLRQRLTRGIEGGVRSRNGERNKLLMITKAWEAEIAGEQLHELRAGPGEKFSPQFSGKAA